MKVMNVLRFFLVILAVVGFAVSCNKDTELTNDSLNAPGDDAKMVTFKKSEPIPGQYIVVFKNNEVGDRALKESTYEGRKAMMREKAEAVLQSLRIETNKIDRTYGTALNGFSVANFTEEEARALAAHAEVEYVEQDQTISIQGGPPGGGGGGGGGNPPPQEIPWGIGGANGIGGSSSGADLRAWIIDTGIDTDHPDLNVDVANGANFSSGNSFDDGNGHGTHVSGTVAAVDNTIGVVGVAAGALVVPVRVLNNAGSGTTSGVIAGVDYVGAKAASGDAANMSLGGGVSTSLDQAVITASNYGGKNIYFALAAGNETDDANNHSPARAGNPNTYSNTGNIYVVSAMSSNGVFASFSNFGNSSYGQPIDYCAPGVGIFSTWKGGGYNTISGTSMATPHVCGLLALGVLSGNGTVVNDPDNHPDPKAHN